VERKYIVNKLNVTTSSKGMKDTYPDNFDETSNDIHYCIAKVDTGASSHYFMAQNKNI
jgi:hypothetical protein